MAVILTMNSNIVDAICYYGHVIIINFCVKTQIFILAISIFINTRKAKLTERFLVSLSLLMLKLKHSWKHSNHHENSLLQKRALYSQGAPLVHNQTWLMNYSHCKKPAESTKLSIHNVKIFT
ncbi:hypothetical protein EB796_009696 [Bugula neritina]|uniref:Uncharacterized protein n=1 Tax=Bugula neritina TaxID=10212 RepID=A0A7J7K1Z4_BUGNE|nr:hypothetical protein EB796_009696 [Bugula neritina]